MSPAVTPDHRFSLEEYAALQEPEGVRSELVRGRLVREPGPGSRHGFVQAELARWIGDHVREGRVGFVVTGSGVVLSRDPPTVRGPDVAYYSTDRVPGPLPEPFFDVPPDLAVEVVSPSDSATQLQAKVGDYLDAGVRMVWVVDPQGGTATSYRSRNRIRLLQADDVLAGEEVLPRLSIRVGDLFPAARPLGPAR
jgi:Uma2 family endonuclease